MKSVGGSLVRIRRPDIGANWAPVFDDPFNRRIDARTPIPFAGGVSVGGSDHSIGTVANCAGGMTPWGNVLTCEENYDEFYGEAIYSKEGRREVKPSISELGWSRYFPYAPEHYGWVVEVNPRTGTAQKHTSMGRFAHEGATVTFAKDGNCVVYSADDANDRCFYKFISSRPGSLEVGTLYVADLDHGVWRPLVRDQYQVLRKRFRSQLDVLIRARESAPMIGGTALDRPEGVAINPRNGDVLVALTNNKPKGNLFGSILRICEENGDHASTRFTHSTVLTGGPDVAMACPDNICFDRNGRLWVATDMSKSDIGTAAFAAFGNNGLFVVQVDGDRAGYPLRVATAPHDAELTGPCFTADGSTLFLAVQHPGEATKRLSAPTSRWNLDADGRPRPAVVAIENR